MRASRTDADVRHTRRQPKRRHPQVQRKAGGTWPTETRISPISATNVLCLSKATHEFRNARVVAAEPRQLSRTLIHQTGERTFNAGLLDPEALDMDKAIKSGPKDKSDQIGSADAAVIRRLRWRSACVQKRRDLDMAVPRSSLFQVIVRAFWLTEAFEESRLRRRPRASSVGRARLPLGHFQPYTRARYDPRSAQCFPL